MNKATLIETVAAKAGVAKQQAEGVIEALLTVTMDTIKSGGEVTLTGFGTFSARVRKGREGINPRTKASITIQPVKVVKFKAGKVLKETLKASQSAASVTPPPAPPSAGPAAPVQ